MIYLLQNVNLSLSKTLLFGTLLQACAELVEVPGETI
ncbi:hypothetical protein SAMN05444483_1108 [Salegentibacter echinorum]|uniref:Uncharacterized protein n=1 Tax=Salegentibacter echinorum TaxID=1073325 RepID=A0A1M5J782_SALEC|nr:hypothetical protein SAMN05444483_1108 [Salegentibacter echinorum]